MKCCLVILFAVIVWNANAENDLPLLKNPGFEEVAQKAGNSGTYVPKIWKIPRDGVGVVSDVSRPGNHYLIMNKSNKGRVVAMQYTKLEKIGWYTFSANVRTGTENSTKAQLVVFNNRQLDKQSQRFSLSPDWQEVSVSFEVTVPNFFRLRLVGWNATGNVLWDDVKLTYYGDKKPEGADIGPSISKFWHIRSYEERKRLPENLRKEKQPRPSPLGPSPTEAGDVVIERPTLHSLGFEWYISGDYNRNGKVDLKYRKSGSKEWKKALPMLRSMYEISGRPYYTWVWTCPNMYAGSIMNLEPGTEYEVKLLLSDPDGGGVEKIVKTSTKRMPNFSENGKKLYLYSADFKGEKKQPVFFDLQKAYDSANPGDSIIVHAGIYNSKPVSGVKDRYEDIERRYYIPPEKKENKRMYDNYDVSFGTSIYRANKKASFDKPIIIRNAGDGEVVFNGGGAGVLFDMRGGEYNYFDGIKFKNAERIFFCSGTKALVVRNCVLEECRYGIDERPGPKVVYRRYGGEHLCTDFTITDNIITGRWPAGKWSDSWKNYVSKYGYENLRKCIGIQIGGQGHDVGFNKIGHFWDGVNIYPITQPPEDRALRNSSIDIYNNYIFECPDDGVEMDYGVNNIRVLNNFIQNCHMGISVQPLHGGPGYAIRNLIYNCRMFPFKIAVWPSGLVAYHNTCINRMGFRFVSQAQNSRFVNNLFVGSDTVATGPIWTGFPTAQTSFMDYNGHRRNGCKKIFWVYGNPDNELIAGGYNFFDSLAEFAKATGYEKHGTMEIDFDDFIKIVPATGKHLDLKGIDPRLSKNSKAVDKGKILFNVNDGFKGKAPDLGAYEQESKLTHYGPRKLEGKNGN